MPALRQRMTETVQRPLRQGDEPVGRDEQHTRRAERQETVARADGADTNGRGCIIPATASNRDFPPPEPPGLGHFIREIGRDLRPLHQIRHLRALHGAGVEEHIVPAALSDIEPQCACRIRHLRHIIAREPIAQVILWQEHLGGFLEDLRLVPRHPDELRRGEAGHGRVRRADHEIRHSLQQLRAFAAAAPVIPQDRRPQHPALAVEQGGAVLLAGKADAFHLSESLGREIPDPRDGLLRGLPPFLRILLRPHRPRPQDLDRSRSLGDQRLILVEKHGLYGRCTDIDTEIGRHQIASPC
ncbi:hypothetical protein ATN84_11490 [Paramesorhizobium deserti]|uniref:Uncharacterized protein n=1 Tax=Paramesorhizobium deserti TaxID=1494590 RepID=A0A135HTZ7_9HYPH|nr:hypothetical protein ATN84_11490 [Paramesorhizobium deserti]